MTIVEKSLFSKVMPEFYQTQVLYVYTKISNGLGLLCTRRNYITREPSLNGKVPYT
jgi:hypothetical protein